MQDYTMVSGAAATNLKPYAFASLEHVLQSPKSAKSCLLAKTYIL